MRPVNSGQFAEISWVHPIETDGETTHVRFHCECSSRRTPGVYTRLQVAAFKRVLQKTPVGTLANLEGLFGDLAFHNSVSCPAILPAAVAVVRFAASSGALRTKSFRISSSSSMRADARKDAPFLGQLIDVETKSSVLSL